MVTGTKKSGKRRRVKRTLRRSKNRFIGKPSGKIQERVQQVGPEHFGVVSVDCAKRRSKWMLTDFYGRVIVEPTTVEHTAGAFKAMTDFSLPRRGVCETSSGADETCGENATYGFSSDLTKMPKKLLVFLSFRTLEKSGTRFAFDGMILSTKKIHL